MANFQLLSDWGIASPDCPGIEIYPDPALAKAAETLLPHPVILCHLATSQPKKEWPLAYWAELYRLAVTAGQDVVFSTGITPREQALLKELKQRLPDVPVLPALPDLATFLAVVKRARLFIGGDTGPLHFAAGLGVPTIGLFGPSSAAKWAPLGREHRALQGGVCSCDVHSPVCLKANACMATISPATVLRLVLDRSANVEGDAT